MSKEIYQEYIKEALFGLVAKDEFLYNGNAISSYAFWMNGVFVPKNFELFTRVPKKHNINGYEVIAPRYDMPKLGDQCYWINLAYTQRFATYDAESLNDKERIVLTNNGWFDNKKDIVAYTKALLESK